MILLPSIYSYYCIAGTTMWLCCYTQCQWLTTSPAPLTLMLEHGLLGSTLQYTPSCTLTIHYVSLVSFNWGNFWKLLNVNRIKQCGQYLNNNAFFEMCCFLSGFRVWRPVAMSITTVQIVQMVGGLWAAFYVPWWKCGKPLNSLG